MAIALGDPRQPAGLRRSAAHRRAGRAIEWVTTVAKGAKIPIDLPISIDRVYERQDGSVRDGDRPGRGALDDLHRVQGAGRTAHGGAVAK